VSNSSDQFPASLPGYTLSTRLGAGGYGEVWKAHAPGGLEKAVKFIYGAQHEKRAEIELKALERVKEVRHPFLLSLERIEVVDGRLVIVTELAEGSLKDRFDECYESGKPGIPRQELLGYLRDAADALDFLSARHQLQHLDVKPENLLLSGGHVKVADFGLVKDLAQTQASLVGGLTPLYSSPEVFQGAPSKFSDQYSLAVLYVEMLTGVPPFSGTTPAELTLQHIDEQPDLTGVPVCDRYLLARGLAKDPSKRYATCTEMVEALLNSSENAIQEFGAANKGTGESDACGDRGGARPTPAAPRPAGVVTQMFDEDLTSPRTCSSSMLVDIAPLAHPEAIENRPIEVDARGFAPQPTLVIGIGGTAAGVLQQMRRGVKRRFGDQAQLPSLQFLLIDSDSQSIAEATRAGEEQALRTDETLCVPLRRPQEYRDRSKELTKWLSRRWIYNIPKSLKTEGLRPLGRLAFSDHARRIVQRIRMAVTAAMDPNGISESTAQSGLSFQSDAVRVIVVASISGGTGSGMSLDLGYCVRSALRRLGIAKATTLGVMLHSTGRNPRHCDLARVNAFSWLSEYHHFNRPGGGFPGDETCGLTSQDDVGSTFDSTYLVELGYGLESEAFAEATARVADYLLLDTLSAAQKFFDEYRRIPPAPGESPAALRTFAVRTFPAASEEVIASAARELRYRSVLRWAGDSDGATRAADMVPTAKQRVSEEDPTRDTNQAVRGGAQLVGRVQLQLDGLASNSRLMLEAQFDTPIDVFLADLLQHAGGGDAPPSVAQIKTSVDRLFAPPSGSSDQDVIHILQRPVHSVISPLAMKLAGEIGRWVLSKLDDRQERLPGAERAAQWLGDHLECVERDGEKLVEGFKRKAHELIQSHANALSAGGGKPPDAARQQQLLASYFKVRLDLAAAESAVILARRVKLELRTVSDALNELGRHLRRLAETLAVSPEAETSTDECPAEPAFHRNAMLAHALKTNPEELNDILDDKLDNFLTEQGGLFQTVMGNTRVRTRLIEEMTRVSLEVARRIAQQSDALASLRSRQRAEHETEDLRELAHNTNPSLMRFGGHLARLIMLPGPSSQDADEARRYEQLAQYANLAASPQNEVVLCAEGWGLSVPHLALELIQRRRDYVDFANRVHTRSDVDWEMLVDTTTSRHRSPAIGEPVEVLT
jgi:serine/threonine protein kinase